MEPNVGKELYKIMDALVALKIDLECAPEISGDALVLTAEKARNACEALDSASASIKHLVSAFGEQQAGDEPLH